MARATAVVVYDKRLCYSYVFSADAEEKRAAEVSAVVGRFRELLEELCFEHDHAMDTKVSEFSALYGVVINAAVAADGSYTFVIHFF